MNPRGYAYIPATMTSILKRVSKKKTSWKHAPATRNRRSRKQSGLSNASVPRPARPGRLKAR